MLTLITGGARSGKSRYGLALAARYARPAVIATAEAFDGEMRRRIETHRRERGALFHTVEEPRDLAGALHALPAGTDVAVIDCLTVWLGNLSFGAPPSADLADPRSFEEVGRFLAFLAAGSSFDLVAVTNEVGMGIVPAEPATRAFRDLAGRVNQQVASIADRVVLMVSGLPLEVKRA